MSATILDGKALAEQLKLEIAAEVDAFRDEKGIRPCLAVVMAGEDPASKVYVKRIAAACEAVHIECRQVLLEEGASPSKLQATLRELNQDASVHGVIVQMPVPPPLTQSMVTDVLAPAKDVDGICPTSAGLLALNQEGFVPNTPLGGIELLKRYQVPIEGTRAVVLGRSNVVGKPMALLLLAEHATVTICHSRTRELARLVKEADILVAAIGKARFVTADMVKPGAAVLDFGINPGEKGIVGDVDFEEVKEVAGWITPVPGGTGPMTNMMLMCSTLAAARRLVAR